jgi:MFS family permease
MWQNKTKFKIYFYVLLLISIYAAAYDMYVAALPTLEHYFSTSANAIQITVTVFAAASILTSIPIGMLNDGAGRKITLQILLLTVIIGCVLCLLTHNIYIFYLGRALQGIGGSGLFIVAMTIPKDILSQKDFLKIWQWLTLAFFIAPSIATALGSYIVFHINWQAIFYAIIAVSLISLIIIIFVFEESAPRQPKTKENNNKVPAFKKYKTVLLNPKFLTYSYTTALAWAGMSLYYLFLPFLIVNHYGYNIIIFGWIAFSMVMAGVFGRVFNMLIFSKIFTLEKTALTFCVINVFSSLLLIAAIALPNALALIFIIISCIIFGFSSSISAIAGSSIALSIFDKELSSAASASYGLMIDCLIAVSLVIAPLFSTSIITLAIMLVILTGIALVFVYRNQNTYIIP